MLFDARDSGNRARLNVAPGPLATLGESARSAAEDVLANDLSVSANLLLQEQYDQYLEGVNALTGKQFRNPFSAAERPEDFAVLDPNPALERAFDRNPSLRNNFQTGTRARAKTAEQRERELFEQLSALQQEFPDIEIQSPEEIRDSVRTFRAQTRQRRADVAAREDALGSIVSFGASAGTFFLDPPILASLPFGAPFSQGILRAAAIDAGIAAGVEVPIQATVQAARRRLGEETSLSEAAINVLTVGAGGFLFSGLLRGGARGTKALVGKLREQDLPAQSQRDAFAHAERQIDLEDQNPFGDLPPSKAEHEVRLSEAQLAAREGKAPSFRDRPTPPVRRGEVDQAPLADQFNDAQLEPASNIASAGAALRQEVSQAQQEAAERIAETFRPFIGGDDADLVAFLDLLRSPLDEPKSLASFLTSRGGISDQDISKALDLPQKRPELFKKKGLSLSRAATQAFKEGFFPKRPTVDELIAALGDDRPLFRQRARDESEAVAALRSSIDDTLSDFDELGFDLKDPEIASRLREVVDRPSRAPEATPGTMRATSEARKDRATLDRTESNQASIDDALARQVRDEFADDLDQRVLIEDANGDVRQASVREVLEDLEGDETLLREFRECIT